MVSRQCHPACLRRRRHTSHVLMTAVAALAGFLPLVVANGAGASAQQSLGTVIFGGLVVATVLSVGVVPPVYVLVKDLESKLMSPSE